METNNYTSVITTLDGDNPSTNLRRYRCNYRDVKNQYKPAVQFINAESVNTAVRIFVENRCREGWENEKIFIDSLLLVIEEDTQKQYVFNTSGELEIHEGVEPD